MMLNTTKYNIGTTKYNIGIRDLGLKKEKVHKTRMKRGFPLRGMENSVLMRTNDHAALFIGRSASGKTSLLTGLLKNQYKKRWNNIYFFSPSTKTMSSNMQGVVFFDSLDYLFDLVYEIEEEYKAGLEQGLVPFSLIVIDDFAAELKNKEYKQILKKIFLNRSHVGVSVWMISQYYSLIPSELRKNNSHLFLFRTGAYSERLKYYEEIGIFYQKKAFMEMLFYCWEEPYSFVYINKHENLAYKKFDELIYEKGNFLLDEKKEKNEKEKKINE